jgi:hypothetical protein
MTLTKQTYIKFQWLADTNPNDPSGVATFSYGNEKVIIGMCDFNKATKLNSMIEKAVGQSKMDALDGAMNGISNLLNRYKYD